MTTLRFIDAEKANHSVVRLCSALSVSRAASCARKRSGSSARVRADLVVEVRLRDAWRASRGTCGAPRLTRELRESGFTISRKRVALRMRKNSLAGLPKPVSTVMTDSANTEQVAPNLLKRDFTVERPNQPWVADIPYVATKAGWLFVAVLIDLTARRVVRWEAATHLRTDQPLAALEKALRLRQPPTGLIHPSDRGCQYGSAAYVRERDAHGVIPSMSRPRDCWDIAVAESFFGSLKTEALNRQTWESPEAAKRAVAGYIHDFCNPQRRHVRCGLRSPQQHESAFNLREAGSS